ncbi:hypothetical protein [Paenibacillus sp. FSL H8-0537]|uniref:hypothetical protein n=1 Tax=Paenibacillus sp. FSL H8-0537 TaxID=2921399 RepID=UPI003100DCFC
MTGVKVHSLAHTILINSCVILKRFKAGEPQYAIVAAPPADEIVVDVNLVAETKQLGKLPSFLADCGSAILAFKPFSGLKRTGNPLLPASSCQNSNGWRISGS